MRAFVIATFAAAASLAVPANAATITSYKVAGWNMGAYTNDKTGRFSHCAASAQYRNGLLLLFSVNESFQWSIGFSNQDWNLREGRSFDITFNIDGGRMNTVRGTAVTNRLIRAGLPDSVELFNQFRQGLRLVVNVDDNSPANFNLTDTNPMLTAILQCAQKYKGHVANNDNRSREGDREFGPGNNNRVTQPDRNPQPNSNTGLGSGGSRKDNNLDNRVARAPDRDDDPMRPDRQPEQPPANTPAVGPTPEARKEATEIATDILRRANFTFEFQKPEQLTGALRDKYDTVWRADGILGTLRILTGARGASIDKLRGELIADDASSCKGKFASGAVPAMSGSRSQSIYTSCEGQNNWSVYYIAVPRRKGGIYLLGIAGTGEAAARLQNVANAYRTVALEVLER